ncbi:tail fiber protein [Bacillus tianshenii]|nr:tail fiber protein [Bacillus tianshenii]
MDQFIGEIRPFAGNFAPRDWAFCNGQLMSISQNTALFSIIGTAYGGDGITNFALPDLRGRAPMHSGTGSGLTPRVIGEEGGTTTVTLIESEMPNHNHLPNCKSVASDATPINNIWASVPSGKGSKPIYTASANTTMNPQALQPSGGNQSHNNMQPYLGLNFIIALDGDYPIRP